VRQLTFAVHCQLEVSEGYHSASTSPPTALNFGDDIAVPTLRHALAGPDRFALFSM